MQLSVACKEYYDELRKAFDKWYDLLDFVYDTKEELKQDAINALKTRLLKSRSYVVKQQYNQKNSQQRNPQQQRKPNQGQQGQMGGQQQYKR